MAPPKRNTKRGRKPTAKTTTAHKPGIKANRKPKTKRAAQANATPPTA